MTSESALSTPERVLRLLDDLGIGRAHFAGGTPNPIGGLLVARPEIVASATVVGPAWFDPGPFRGLGGRLLAIHGDSGPMVGGARRALAELPAARALELGGYAQFLWSDLVADRAEEVARALIGLIDGTGPTAALPPAGLPECKGEVAGVTYRIRGAGPPLVLFPLSLAPTQWEALLSRLAERYCTISLGGPYIGWVAMLEERAGTRGYLGVVGAVVDALGVRPDDRVLEVGCGSGALCRYLARRTGAAVVGVDINRYLLGEAAALTERDGLADRIDFREGNAEALPFDDGIFDVVLSSTVMEEVDADRLVAEMVRVARPGGRIGAVVRAEDVPSWFNVRLRPELKAKVEGIKGAGAVARGCADGSLIHRFVAAGLWDTRGWPQLATTYPGRDVHGLWAGREAAINAALTAAEAEEWRAAVAEAQADGTFCWAAPFHCAVGTKV